MTISIESGLLACMNASIRPISLGKILIFWMPLAFTWLMMAAEGPLLTALIARLSEAKFNLAAFGIAISLALIVEAPIIMIMSASTALVKDSQTLRKLFRYTLLANCLITLAMVMLVLPPVFRFLTDRILGLSEEIAWRAHGATALLLPWPAAIGFRRFYQGILIRNNLTRRVAYGTLIRLALVCLSALACYQCGDIPGAYVGALALSVAVTAEAIASRLMTSKALQQVKANNHSCEEPLTYRTIHRFYVPLALTSILTLAAHPIVTFFMVQGRMPIESLAVLPVLNAFIFIFRSFGLSYQEVVVAKTGAGFEMYGPVRNFALFLGMALVTILGAIAFSPAVYLWYCEVSGLSVDLASLAILPTRLLVLIPALSVWISFQRGILVAARYTRPVTIATLIELAGIVLVLLAGIHWLDWVGVVAAAIAYLIGRLAANMFLIAPCIAAIRRASDPIRSSSTSSMNSRS